ncbi:MAG: hypothetical protein NT076_04950 [Candidatus Pacearchaeota archaeon]|nr:hypothetical protein [Candidatus Pacearchaeota archaeon]
MRDVEQLKADNATKAWLGFLFNTKARSFEYFGRHLDGEVFVHSELWKVRFREDCVYRYRHSGLTDVVEKSFYNLGFKSWQYLAFKTGFEGARKPSLLHPFKRHFYYLGKKENS